VKPDVGSEDLVADIDAVPAPGVLPEAAGECFVLLEVDDWKSIGLRRYIQGW